MSAILLAVGILAGLGLVFGLILSIASAVMAVPRDEKVEALKEVLPGANCGACGYSGCEGYAQAMAHEGARVGLCSPGGAAVAEATAEILGVSNTGVKTQVALVRCAAALQVGIPRYSCLTPSNDLQPPQRTSATKTGWRI